MNFQMKLIVEKKVLDILVKNLVWSEVFEPNEEKCRYNHIFTKTAFGEILITWKGWKECDNFYIEFPFEWSFFNIEQPHFNSLENAQNFVQYVWNNHILSLLEEKKEIKKEINNDLSEKDKELLDIVNSGKIVTTYNSNEAGILWECLWKYDTIKKCYMSKTCASGLFNDWTIYSDIDTFLNALKKHIIEYKIRA